MPDDIIDYGNSCIHCGYKELWTAHEIFYSDPIYGRYRVPLTECDYCTKCMTYYMEHRSMVEEENYVHDFRCRIVLEKYPFGDRFWMPLSEAVKILGSTEEEFWSKKSRWLFSFITESNGKWYMLRKSVERHLNGEDELFWLGDCDEIDECYRD